MPYLQQHIFAEKKAIESDKTKLNNWVKTELTKLVFQQ